MFKPISTTRRFWSANDNYITVTAAMAPFPPPATCSIVTAITTAIVTTTAMTMTTASFPASRFRGGFLELSLYQREGEITVVVNKLSTVLYHLIFILTPLSSISIISPPASAAKRIDEMMYENEKDFNDRKSQNIGDLLYLTHQLLRQDLQLPLVL